MGGEGEVTERVNALVSSSDINLSLLTYCYQVLILVINLISINLINLVIKSLVT